MLQKKEKAIIVGMVLGGIFVGIFFGGMYIYRHKKHAHISSQLKNWNSAWSSEKNVVPIAIIGSGPAGLSAAVYAARLGFYSVVFQGKNPGGQLVTTSYVENWPGIQKMLGSDIIAGLRKQAEQFGAVMSPDAITDVNFSTWPYTLTTEENKKIRALTVIIATGSSARLLKVPGEQEFWGKGVTTCAICDAPFYKNKEVIVVGGGDSAAEEVMQLAPYAQKINLFVRGSSLRASHAMQQHLKEIKQLTIFFNSKIREIKGTDHVNAVDYEQDGVRKTQTIDGVFLAIGHEPNTALFRKNVACTSAGYIKPVLGTQKTSVRGVFVAGDVADERYRQAGVAAGDGIKAALDAASFLHEHGYNEAFAHDIEDRLYIPEAVVRQAITVIKNSEELDALIAGSSLPVLVDFYTPQCPTCMQMMPSVEAIAAQKKESITIVKVDGSIHQDIMKKWHVGSVPHMLVFKDGALVGRTKEVMTKKEILTFVQQFFDVRQ